MSTSLLYHGWGLRGYQYVRTTYEQSIIRFSIEQDPSTFCCSACGCRDVMKSGVVRRRFRSLPIGSKRATIELPVQRLWCAGCGKTRQAKITFADQRRGYTHSFERYEISIGSGHKYLTVVLDLDSGAVVYVGEGKGADSLLNFFKRLRASHARIKAVATDMSPAYTAAVRDNLPKAIHVFDRFHLVKFFNEKFSLFRQALQREAEGPLAKKVLKGTRWLLLKNPENLDDERDERKRLEKALALNKPLATVYYMKEDLRQIWDQQNKRAANVFMNDWIARAQSSGIQMLQKFAVTLAEHRHGILAYYDCRLTTAALEGTNNKIKTMQRQAYGFRDPEFLKLKIYALHETNYALVG